MTREQAKQLLPIIQAWADGKDVQGWDVDKEQWYTFKESVLFTKPVDEYRIKPQYTYRPFKSAEECWQEMQKHQPFGWICDSFSYFAIIRVICDHVTIADSPRQSNVFFDDALGWFFADGTPFGIKREE